MAEIKDALTDTGRQPSSAELRSEIERTRADMDQTFDALERKMTPGQILEEVWFLTRGGTRAGASKLWQVARQHPLPATVIGLGVGWMLVESSRGDGGSSSGYSRSEYNRARGGAGRGTWPGRTSLHDSSAGYGVYPESYNTGYQESWESESGSGLKDRVSSTAGSVKGAAAHAKDSVTGAASSAGHKVADVADDVREHASDLGHKTREKAGELKYRTQRQARRAQTGFWQMMEENPLAVGVATLALGVLAGLSLPSTRREDELLGETRDRMVDKIEEAGREALDKGKQIAETTVETLKDETESAGLTASGIADKVREVGRHTTETVKEEVKSQSLTGQPGSQQVGSNLGSTTGSGSTGTTGTTGTTGSRGKNTPRETITPVEPELSNKR